MKKNKALPGIIIAIVGILLYLNTLNHGYVLDDITVITRNHLVQQGIKGIPQLLKTSYWFGYNGSTDLGYRPLSLVMFAIEWQISPDNSHINHLVNILLYGATGFLLFLTLIRLFPQPVIPKGGIRTTASLLSPLWGVAGLASLLFIIHPIHTEVVANIKSRDEMLSFFFSLSTIYFLIGYLNNTEKKNLIFSLVSFFLALISKENSITIFAIVPLVIYYKSSSGDSKQQQAIKSTIIKITGCFAVIIIGYILLRLALPEGFKFRKSMPIPDNSLLAAPDILTRLASATAILGRYLLKLVFPITLISDYSYNHIPLVGWSDWKAFTSLVIYLLLIVYAFRQLRRKDFVAFGILFFLITLTIVSNILFLVGATLAERFLYMPSLGFCIVIAVIIKPPHPAAAGGLGILEYFRKHKLPLWGLGGLLIFYSYKTFSRNKYWSDNLTLFTEDLKSAPNSSKLNYYYAVSLLDSINSNPAASALDRDLTINKAVDHLKNVLSITGDFVEAYEEIGYAYYLKGDLGTAIDYYEKARTYGSKNSSLFNNYGAALSELRQYDKAVEMFKRSFELNANYPEALNNMGSALNSMNKYAEAISYLQKSIALKPDYLVAYKNISRSYANVKRFDDAIDALKKAATLSPNDYEIYLYMGLSYQYKGDAENARLYLQKSKELKK